MGQDDLFHKRRERNRKSLERAAARRAPYARILITCEGEKTEPEYFMELRKKWRLSAANIEITGDCGSDPMSVVSKAIQIFCKDDGYDYVYCVFDKDRHPNFDKAKQKVAMTSLKQKGNGKKIIKFQAIISVPCFEYWLLIHYVYTDKLFSGSQKKSVCEQVVQELNKHIDGYTKGKKGILQLTEEKLDTAIENSKKIISLKPDDSNDYPSTLVHELIEHLQELREASRKL